MAKSVPGLQLWLLSIIQSFKDTSVAGMLWEWGFPQGLETFYLNPLDFQVFMEMRGRRLGVWLSGGTLA
jgi:hypothetical protein